LPRQYVNNVIALKITWI